MQDFWCGPGETCTRLSACQWRVVTTYITGPDPRYQTKQKEPFMQELFLLTSREAHNVRTPRHSLHYSKSAKYVKSAKQQVY